MVYTMVYINKRCDIPWYITRCISHGISHSVLTCCWDVVYHGFFLIYTMVYIMCFAYTMVYTMVFGVLTCCWDVVHHGFLWYISIFSVIYWVDLGYIPVFTGPYHSAISQRCVIPVLRCDMSDDRV